MAKHKTNIIMNFILVMNNGTGMWGIFWCPSYGHALTIQKQFKK
jgi:hypothetical protein